MKLYYGRDSLHIPKKKKVISVTYHLVDEDVSECGCIEEDIPIEEVRTEPYTLPQGFVWDTLDISDAKVVCQQYCALLFCFIDSTIKSLRLLVIDSFLMA